MKLKSEIDQYIEQRRFATKGVTEYEGLIQHYVHGSRFQDHFAINSRVRKSVLNFYFFKDDFPPALSQIRDNCAYLNTNEFEMIICDVDFLTNWHNAFPGAWEPNIAKRYKSSEVPQDVLQRTDEILSNMLGGFFTQWVLAHEIGHAVLQHSPGHFLAMPDGTIKELSVSKQRERDADLFAIRHIFNDQMVRFMFWISICQVVASWVYAETGKSAVDLGTSQSDGTVIEIPSRSSTHPPLTIRVLDMVNVLLAEHPDIDTSGYFSKLSKMIRVVPAFD